MSMSERAMQQLLEPLCEMGEKMDQMSRDECLELPNRCISKCQGEFARNACGETVMTLKGPEGSRKGEFRVNCRHLAIAFDGGSGTIVTKKSKSTREFEVAARELQELQELMRQR